MAIPLAAYWTLLVGYLRPQWPRVASLAVLVLGGIGLQLWGPLLLRRFIDGAVAGVEDDRLTGLALLFIGVAIANQTLAALAKYLGESIGWTATNELRADLAAHCLDLDQSFHKGRTPGEMVERIDGDVTLLSTFFAQLAIDLLGNVALTAGVLILLFREDWRVGLALSLFALVALGALLGIRSIAVPHLIAVRQATADFFGFLGERLAGLEDIRSSGAEGYTLRRFRLYLRSWLPVQRRAYLAGGTLWMTTLGIFALGNAIAFALGATLYRAGAITIGTVYLIFSYTELLRRPVEQIRAQFQELQQASASIGRVRELFAVASRLPDGPGVPLPPGPLAVEFDRVTFHYDDRDDDRDDDREARDADEACDLDERNDDAVLRALTFRLAAGQTLALLGRTGSGKTTLARLVARLYDPTDGEVRLGGVPLRAAALADLRGRIGVVTQDVQLFAGTVRDNLTFFNPAIPDEHILATLDALGLVPWLRALPAGLDSILSADGGGLSAGQAQLLAFARVFLRDPGLVILDEASSRLDPATERLIERAVDMALRGRTGIIIAHRLETVRRADVVLILDSGQIAEWGERAALAADPTSRYSRLLRADVAAREVLA